jgi:hypothetical protein
MSDEDFTNVEFSTKHPVLNFLRNSTSGDASL